MSGESSLYALSQNKLLEDANNIRSMVVNWRSYHQSQMISNDDFEFIHQLWCAFHTAIVFYKIVGNFQIILHTVPFLGTIFVYKNTLIF